MEGSNILARKKDHIIQEKEMEEEDSIDLIDYLKIVWRYRYFIVTRSLSDFINLSSL